MSSRILLRTRRSTILFYKICTRRIFFLCHQIVAPAIYNLGICEFQLPSHGCPCRSLHTFQLSFCFRIRFSSLFYFFSFLSCWSQLCISHRWQPWWNSYCAVVILCLVCWNACYIRKPLKAIPIELLPLLDCLNLWNF